MEVKINAGRRKAASYIPFWESSQSLSLFWLWHIFSQPGANCGTHRMLVALPQLKSRPPVCL